jgi:flagellar basal body-associated protein FliL
VTHQELNVILVACTVVVMVGTLIGFLFFMRWAKAEGERAKRFREIHGKEGKRR